MTSALSGGNSKADNITDSLLECDSKVLKMLQTTFMYGPMLRPPAIYACTSDVRTGTAAYEGRSTDASGVD